VQHTKYEIRDARYDFTGKTVLVMGLGRFGGGSDVAEFAAKAGAKVIVTDLAEPSQLSDSVKLLKSHCPDVDIEFHLGSHDPADFERADIIVANPAVAPDNEFLELARRCEKPITSQIGIFFELCTAPIIGITGANGKSTTAALTAHLLENTHNAQRTTHNEKVIARSLLLRGAAKQSQQTHYAPRNTHNKKVIARSLPLRGAAKQSQRTQYAIRNTQYEKVWLSGNIGNQPLLTSLESICPDDLVVLELSSFQLEQLAQLKKAPKVALLTNLSPNHLDRHGTFADYCAAKENIFRLQTLNEDSPAVSIFNAEDKIAAEWFEKYKSDTGRICIKFSTDDVSGKIRDAFTLPGRANLSNLAAALAVARCFGLEDGPVTKALPKFKPLPHHLEFVEQINGVRWYNDSIATTPQSAIAALEAFEQPKIIIAGGYDKNLPFDELGEKIAENAKAAILLGRTAHKIASAIRNAEMSLRAQRSNLNERNTRYAIRDTKIELVDSLSEAVQLAHRLAVSGDVVLLSPACASYDMFDNFQQRGREFVRLVNKINC